ncbi:MAG: hypothetical protein JO112_21745 [Planctomycetes bacterium]|nr:hypothetical protein [Planctomycetota bacterium]
MKPDGMLVEPEHVATAHQTVTTRGTGEVLEEVGQTEPALAGFLCHHLAVVAGKLALCGAPTETVQGVHEDLLTIVLTCIEALRRGHYELWKDTMTGTRLAQLDDSFQGPPAAEEGTPPPKRRRQKRPGSGSGQ